MSAESGIQTFRDSNGLWEDYNIHDVATPEAWRKNSDWVNEFYNQRRKQIIQSQPNSAHYAIVELEKYADVGWFYVDDCNPHFPGCQQACNEHVEKYNKKIEIIKNAYGMDQLAILTKR